jgi:hypothetical protein
MPAFAPIATSTVPMLSDPALSGSTVSGER